MRRPHGCSEVFSIEATAVPLAGTHDPRPRPFERPSSDLDGISRRAGYRPNGASGSLTAMGTTIFGVVSVSFMMLMYAFESRGRAFVLAFALGCILSSAYGFLAHTWPFGIVELIWSGIAVRRWIVSGDGKLP